MKLCDSSLPDARIHAKLVQGTGSRGEISAVMSDLHKVRLPAGWYPDPEGGEFRRWWDGQIWTQHTAPFQKPAPVYDVDDLAEKRARTAATAMPAPRRIRTAARLGRSLAALAHKLPVPRLTPRPDAAGATSVDHPGPQGPTSASSPRRDKAPEASARKRTPAKQGKDAAPSGTKPAAPKKAVAPKKASTKSTPGPKRTGSGGAAAASQATPKKAAAGKASADTKAGASAKESASGTPKKPRAGAAGAARKTGRHAQ